jgi:hypothetical protein
VTRVPYPFRSQIAKVELEGVFCELRQYVLGRSAKVPSHRSSLTTWHRNGFRNGGETIVL